MLNLTKLGKDIFNFKSKISILHNKPLLYTFFIIALIQLVYLLQSGNFYFAAVLLLIGVITRYFSKNMLVIICVALAATNVLMLGPNASHSVVEGFEDDEEEEVEEEMEEDDEEEESTDISGNKPTSTPEPDIPSEGLNNAEESKDLNLALNAENRLKESFNKVDLYDKNSVMDYEKNSDRVILAQEKMLSSINQYKPLLDTINSISKNLSFFNNTKTE
tara:strand:+ start:1263 stop:1919 length:657 start_codon:yes stop_codon:yes gene_type:complete